MIKKDDMVFQTNITWNGRIHKLECITSKEDSLVLDLEKGRLACSPTWKPWQRKFEFVLLP